MEWYNLVSLAGVFLLVGFAWLCSSNRRVVNWRVVCWETPVWLCIAEAAQEDL